MKIIKSALIGVISTVLVNAAAADELPGLFVNLMERAKMTFTMPEGYEPVELIDNPHMNYEYALKHANRQVEVRYAIRPVDSMLLMHKKYLEDPQDIFQTLEPNEMFHISQSMAIAANITGIMDLTELNDKAIGDSFPEESVKREFGADSGTFAVFRQIMKEFTQDYQCCMILSLWKKDLGSAYYFILFDDLPQDEIEECLRSIFYTLKFE